MLHKFLEKLISLAKRLRYKRQDISWKEINGIIKEDRSKK
jgi:hypothetical protein